MKAETALTGLIASVSPEEREVPDDEKLKCFRHRFEDSARLCSLCGAKRRAKGNFEKARRIFIKGK